MSAFISTDVAWGGMGLGWRSFNNDELQPVAYRVTMPGSRWGRNRDADVLWPRSGMIGQTDTGAPVRDGMRQYFEWPSWYRAGGFAPKQIAGIARDSSGNPLGGATVQIFNAATGLLVCTVTADAGGWYQGQDPNAVACFAVAYKAGSPDVFGTTLNTLLGT